jgi:hypothetical protein
MPLSNDQSTVEGPGNSTAERESMYRDLRKRTERRQQRREQLIERRVQQQRRQARRPGRTGWLLVIESVEGPARAEDSGVPPDPLA